MPNNAHSNYNLTHFWGHIHKYTSEKQSTGQVRLASVKTEVMASSKNLHPLESTGNLF